MSKYLNCLQFFDEIFKLFLIICIIENKGNAYFLNKTLPFLLI